MGFRLFVTLILTFLLSACMRTVQVPGEPLPEFVVLLTSPYPTIEARCTGIAVDSHLLLTMDHCIDGVKRLITQRGQETTVEAVARYPEIDIAVLQTKRPLRMAEFAHFRSPEPAAPVLVFGACPWYFVHVPKRADYIGEYSSPHELSQAYHLQLWRVSGNRVCGGDSGGPAVQDGYVGPAGAFEKSVTVTRVNVVSKPWLSLGSSSPLFTGV